MDLGACIGATWIGGGVAGTVDLLRRSLRPGGTLLVGEPYWRREPPDQTTVEACYASSADDFRLLAQFGDLGCDVVEMVLRTELTTEPARYARYPREYLGWGVFALMNR